MVEQGAPGDRFAELSRFRENFYDCLTGRRDALFELTDAVLCTDGPVKTLVGLALAPEHRRGHGAVPGALNRACLDVERLQTKLASLPLAGRAGGRALAYAQVSRLGAGFAGEARRVAVAARDVRNALGSDVQVRGQIVPVVRSVEESADRELPLLTACRRSRQAVMHDPG
ncbi:transposase [Streptomyces sp. LN704]|uniref:transposase n=1 Tax=Streptomyces sp. LN704 TaxID=3112982 RepID=UPI00371F5502